MAMTIGAPPKVIWLQRWTRPTRDAEDLLRRNTVRIAEFEHNIELGILILNRE